MQSETITRETVTRYFKGTFAKEVAELYGLYSTAFARTLVLR